MQIPKSQFFSNALCYCVSTNFEAFKASRTGQDIQHEDREKKMPRYKIKNKRL